ncbi:hypothetical protein [Hyphococcus luteus]|uniref:hypothetical protein n=1 Tax=Hyphococcus luteus TaxID=2058213 RepID=UPI001056F670|nr:hypothetical protein [Marinicaulis flavus]
MDATVSFPGAQVFYAADFARIVRKHWINRYLFCDPILVLKCSWRPVIAPRRTAAGERRPLCLKKRDICMIPATVSDWIGIRYGARLYLTHPDYRPNN